MTPGGERVEMWVRFRNGIGGMCACVAFVFVLYFVEAGAASSTKFSSSAIDLGSLTRGLCSSSMASQKK